MADFARAGNETTLRATSNIRGARRYMINSGSNKISMGAGWFALGLGWFSIVLGLIGIFMPRMVSRILGIRNRPLLLRGIGLREILSGTGILFSGQKAQWLWSRAAGDALDVSLLGAAFTDRKSDKRRLGISTGGIAGIMVADTVSALAHMPSAPVHAASAVTIDRSPEELFRQWRNLENIPRFVPNVKSVDVTDEKHSRWMTMGPAGATMEWDSEITEELLNQKISWRSEAKRNGTVFGSVEFLPAAGGRGTTVRLVMDYVVPLGRFGAAASKAAAVALENRLSVSLHRFEQWMETGFVTTTEGQPAGRAKSTSALYDMAGGR